MLTTETGQRLEAWILDHQEEWSTVCGVGKHPITEEEFLRLYEALMAADLEALTLVLLTCHGYAVYDRMVNRMTVLIQEGDEEQARRAEELIGEHLPS